MRQATNDNQKVNEECAEAAKALRSVLGCPRNRHEYALHNMANMNQTMDLGDLLEKEDRQRKLAKAFLAGRARVRLRGVGFWPRRNCGTFVQGLRIADTIDGSEEGNLHERLADIGAVVPENPDELRNERQSCRHSALSAATALKEWLMNDYIKQVDFH
ncbi:hypothetical protein HPB47_027452 [Ixodes persulcatus]|uniref:Uncharacterized protein n=1 Tax=Ixodes persulcatus TaxID=34615 RepID=A0AC60PW59_IXOPE|nr:hypothetical protein HPB47_027452 [Ixodes persulcatus]